jgi:hypothetical protein
VTALVLFALAGVQIQPFVDIVGGMDVETLQTKPGDLRQDRIVTLALSRFGVGAGLGGGVSLLSEFEANAGPHGTSVWEGQAALQVRRQEVKLERWGLRIEAGRIIDDASVDYFSQHMVDQLLTDDYTRYPLLASGFNLGNGVLMRYAVRPGVEPGFTLNAANPTSTTASLVLGGTYPPFSRFYFAPAEQVGRDANKFPSDEYYILVFSPSIVVHSDIAEASGAVQMFTADTNTSTMDDQPIRGYNIRGGVGLHLFGDQFHPFVNASRVTNGVLDAMNGKIITDTFIGTTISGGLDWNISGRNGIGAEWAWLVDQQGSATRTTQHFVNVGGTLWLGDTTALGARIGIYTRCADQGMGCESEGQRSFFLTLRTSILASL